MLNKIEAGCSLEALEEIAQGFDIFKYRTKKHELLNQLKEHTGKACAYGI